MDTTLDGIELRCDCCKRDIGPVVSATVTNGFTLEDGTLMVDVQIEARCPECDCVLNVITDVRDADDRWGW